VLIRWMERIINNQPPLIFGDGKQTMDFVYIEDIARANICAAKADVTDEVFNIASGKETSLNDLAYSLAKVMGSDLKPEYGAERKVNPVQRRIADVNKAKELIDFTTAVSLEAGLEKLVSWWRSQKQEQETSNV
jgi:UDP-glucose 4-epimerase